MVIEIRALVTCGVRIDWNRAQNKFLYVCKLYSLSPLKTQHKREECSGEGRTLVVQKKEMVIKVVNSLRG